MEKKLEEYRETPREQERIQNILGLIPNDTSSILDIGARDGYLSLKLALMIDSVTALDLEMPTIDHPTIIPVKGDITKLNFSDNTFDAILCAEVLEHLKPSLLNVACQELLRVARKYVIIGVPFEQDIRVGRTTCSACGGKNPPWGHCNSFTEEKLRKLFKGAEVKQTTFVGSNKEKTNALSTLLMDIAGNPYGTYGQEEPCVYCDHAIGNSRATGIFQKFLAKAAILLDQMQAMTLSSHPNWIHIAFEKCRSTPSLENPQKFE